MAAEAARLAQEAAATAQQLTATTPGGPVDDATWQAIAAAQQAARSGQDVARQAKEFKEEADRQLELTEAQIAARQREIELRERELELAEREAEIRRREEAIRAQARAAQQSAAPTSPQAGPAVVTVGGAQQNGAGGSSSQAQGLAQGQTARPAQAVAAGPSAQQGQHASSAQQGHAQGTSRQAGGQPSAPGAQPSNPGGQSSAAGTHSSAPGAQSSAPGAHSPAPVEYRRNVAIRSEDGRGLFLVTIPTNWELSGTRLTATGSVSRPYIPHARFAADGAVMTLTLGMAGSRMSEGMKALMTMYGSASAGIDTSHQGPFPEPGKLFEQVVRGLVPSECLPTLRLLSEQGLGRTSQLQRETFERFQPVARAANAIIKDPFAGELVRVYAFQINGQNWRIATYVRLCAVKDGSGVDVMTPAGLMGTVVGGIFNAGKRAKAKREAERVGTQPGTQHGPRGWCAPDYDEYERSGSIYWNVAGLVAMAAIDHRFDEYYRDAFLPLVTTYDVHPDLENATLSQARQESAAIQQATNREINAMNMRTQATLAAARQAQAAADARFESWQRQSDARHAAFRERTNAQFSGSSRSSADAWSEAIRGVNTYTTSDGREVEVDVRYDRAYENQAGDVMGWDSGFEPGSDWTEIPRS